MDESCNEVCHDLMRLVSHLRLQMHTFTIIYFDLLIKFFNLLMMLFLPFLEFFNVICVYFLPSLEHHFLPETEELILHQFIHSLDRSFQESFGFETFLVIFLPQSNSCLQNISISDISQPLALMSHIFLSFIFF